MLSKKSQKKGKKLQLSSDFAKRNATKSKPAEDMEESNTEFSDGTIFCEQLRKSGIILKKGDHNHELNVEPTVFYKNLSKALKKHINYPEVIDKFLEGLQDYIQIRHRFIKSLMPCTVAKDSAIKSQRPRCLIKLLLEVESLQPKLINILLEKLPEFMDEDESIFSCEESPVNIPRQILTQLQWLENIVNMTALREKLMDVLQVTSCDIQREIISCLPEIMDVTEHVNIITVLKDLLEQEKSLTVSILDNLSNLVLKEELLAEVLTSVLQILPSCELDDLPVVVKFILQSVQSKDALSVFTEMRNYLQFDSLVPIASSTPLPGPSTSRAAPAPEKSTANSELLVMRSINSCLQFEKSLAAPCIKMIEQIHGSGNHQVLDLLLLFLLHSLNHTKAVESLFRNKIRAGDFTLKLLNSAFLQHAVVMQEYFTSIQSLCVTFISSPESSISHFASVMYHLAFQVFDRFCQQEIIDNLITHIGSGMPSEVDMALNILMNLADTCLNLISPFAIFIKGLLDYFDKLRLSQIRKLYSIISQLAFHSDHDGGHTKTDLHIVVKKQLMSNKLKYKQNGIIGGVMLVKNLTPVSADNLVTPENVNDAITLLKLMNTSSLQLASARALFMDELSMVITHTKLHPKVEEWIEENVIADFQDSYVIDVQDDYLKKQTLLPLDFQYSLDDDVEDNVAVIILPLLLYGTASTSPVFDYAESSLSSPLCLVPTLRLLGVQQLQKNNNLDDIMALLGCPLCVTTSQVIEKIETMPTAEKEIICSSLFYTLNWFREIINLFSTQSDPEVSGKVILRLKNITETQELLVKCLAATPGYVPPITCFDTDEAPAVVPASKSASAAPSGAASTSTTNGSKRAKKRKKPNKTSEDSCDAPPENTSGSGSQDASKEGKEGTPNTVDLLSYHQYFRELTIDVLDILLVGKITSKDLDSQMNTETQREVKIEPPQVEFLLKDLTHKLQHAFQASQPKKIFFSKDTGNKNIGFTLLNQKSPEDVAKKTIHLLPALCQQLEGASAFFQALIASNDGIMDSLCQQTNEVSCVVACFQLLLEVFHSLFSWKDIDSPKNTKLFNSALSILATRINPSDSTCLPQQQSIKLAIEYLQNFSDTSPNVQTAVKLVEILITLVEKGAPEYCHKPAELAESFLHRAWLTPTGAREKGATFNKHVQKILKCYLSYSPSPLDAIEKLCSDAIPQLLNADDNTSEMYPSLTTSSFSMFYRVLFNQLVITVKKLLTGKKMESLEAKNDKILQWNLAVRIFQILTTLIKKFDGLPNLGTALKAGRMFVDAFTLQAMPLLDIMYRSQHENIHGLLKSMQLSTRSLHHICNHSKIVKSVCLTNQIPCVKRSLEQLMCRVKVMLSMNKCEEGYMIGVLKNRNLMGDEIPSQVAEESRVVEEDTKEDSPEEEEESDEDKVSDVEIEGGEEVKDDDDKESDGGKENNDDNDGEQMYSEIY
ncbi:Fanconi anemia group D2 protein-like [Octopus vulgaris]|uniref:Fanconi anemia group D2 protein-like n=1 Tax=Octopus vulgaris TaxID=6645 RepID=A0AA36BV00_OCTVU|nr:Fanconi anemia group D2 protein-like [Octopus vulgaris]